MEDLLLINDVAQRVGLSQKRIREYEKEGFIRPQREARTNNRLYSPFEVDQIQRINHLLHERGFTLACLRSLLVMAPCWRVYDCPCQEECSAFAHPHLPCWQVRQSQETLCPGPCPQCAIYLVREHPAEPVFEHPRPGAAWD